MSEPESHVDQSGHNFFSSVSWEELDREEHSGSVVTRLSGSFDGSPGLLVVERCNLGMPATSALVRLRMTHARPAGITSVIQLDEITTEIGVFVRRAFSLMPQRRRTVVAAAAEVEDDLDFVVQLVVPGVDQGQEELEALSQLSIAKALELAE